MRKWVAGHLWVFGTVWALSTDASAHHSITANFDSSKRVEIRGEVVDFKLRSPHSSMVVDGLAFVDGIQQGDEIERWEIESSATSGLRARGIEADSFKPGDRIVVTGTPHRNTDLRRANSSNFALVDGPDFSVRVANQAQTSAVQLPPDAIGPYAVAGRWRPPFQQPGRQSALPLNERGLAAWREYDQKLSPANTCEPMNIPVVFNAPTYYADIRFSESQAVVRNQAYDIVRTVPMSAEFASADEAGFFGMVRGRIDGDTLVIESRDYRPSLWGLGAATQINGGGADVPSSEQKTLVERFSTSQDRQTLVYEYTLFDPVYMSAPHMARIELARVADDAPMYPYECDVDAASMFSRDPGESLLRDGRPLSH